MARLKQVDVSADHFVSNKLCKFVFIASEITDLDLTLHCSLTLVSESVDLHAK